jgi:beta-N-acetylhexosaminidase
LPPYVPLLIGVNHEGNGYPFSEVRGGVTELPSAMAIGATWDPGRAEAMGRIAGAELAAMGINLLLGPSLDVLETPRPESADLGTRVFGGDPFWVGQMGQAYVAGVHAGSQDGVAVIAKHFPGHGGSDRRPDEELPTVRKSFDDLQRFDLVPFYAVTGQAASPAGVADGALVAHIRFQGFQGSIRQNTAPVSFDALALGQLLALPPIADWRANGGITVSDSLGARSIKSYYDPTVQTFPHRQIARGAFNAGNDLLLLQDFGLNPRVDQTSNIVDTLAYFQQQYRLDLNFASRVDAAVRRILALKLRLAGGEFEPSLATRPLAGLDVIGRDQDEVAALAQSAAALIHPSPEELLARAPEPPSAAQRIVFFTDVREGQQCSACGRFSLLDRRELETEVLALFGPNGSGQTRPSSLQSYTFEELSDYLTSPTPPAVGPETPTPEPSPLQGALDQADWLVFAMLNETAAVPWSGVVSTFLAQRPDLVRAKRIVVFAFDAPYYLDTTDLSKVTAFYALYSRAPDFVTVAARLLFRDLTPSGAPPVSVISTGYNLIDVTRPNPSQIIELGWQQTNVSADGTPSPLGLRQGDTITLTTRVIRDHNGNVVPDQTLVTFRVFHVAEGLPEDLVVPTVGGVATVPYQLTEIGRLEITASSEPALGSTTLIFDVQQGADVGVTLIVPTASTTPTPEPTDTPVPASATPTLTPTATPTQPPAPPSAVDWRGFFLMCLGLVAVLVSGYRLGTLEESQTRLGVRVALAGAIGMLLGYNYVALVLPGTAVIHLWLEALAAPVSAVIGGILGLAVGWFLFVGRFLRGE